MAGPDGYSNAYSCSAVLSSGVWPVIYSRDVGGSIRSLSIANGSAFVTVIACDGEGGINGQALFSVLPGANITMPVAAMDVCTLIFVLASGGVVLPTESVTVHANKRAFAASAFTPGGVG